MRVFAPIVVRRRRLKDPVEEMQKGHMAHIRYYDARPWGFGMVRVTGSPGFLTHRGLSLNLSTGEITKE